MQLVLPTFVVVGKVGGYKDLPLSMFRRCVADHNGEHKVKDFACLDQFFAMAFAQLTYRESLRDIEVNLRAQASHLTFDRFQTGGLRGSGDRTSPKSGIEGRHCR